MSKVWERFLIKVGILEQRRGRDNIDRCFGGYPMCRSDFGRYFFRSLTRCDSMWVWFICSRAIGDRG